MATVTIPSTATCSAGGSVDVDVSIVGISKNTEIHWTYIPTGNNGFEGDVESVNFASILIAPQLDVGSISSGITVNNSWYTQTVYINWYHQWDGVDWYATNGETIEGTYGFVFTLAVAVSANVPPGTYILATTVKHYYRSLPRAIYQTLPDVSVDTTIYETTLTVTPAVPVTEPPAKPINPVPANSAVNVFSSLGVLTWEDGNSSAPADNYDVYLDSAQIYDHLSGLIAAVLLPFDYNTEHTWRVDARNSFGLTTGDTWTFTTGALEPPVPADTNSMITRSRLVAVAGDAFWYED